ncbi:MAG TPA: hypothetical protein VE978_12910 [Chitinophagales bacterium]|nr:hypothetical protein [Chitinophagales bacterium]
MKIKRVSVIFFGALIFFSCTKDHAVFPNFTPEELKLVPYSGNEILKFEDSLGNSFTLYGLGRRDTLIDEMKTDCDVCSPGSYLRNNSTTFNQFSTYSDTDLTTVFNLVATGIEGESVEKELDILLRFGSNMQDSMRHGVFRIKIQNNLFVLGTYEHGFSSVNLINNYYVDSAFYSSVYQIFDFDYTVALEHPPTDWITTAKPWVKYIIYSLDKGVLKIELTDGSVWNLVE